MRTTVIAAPFALHLAPALSTCVVAQAATACTSRATQQNRLAVTARANGERAGFAATNTTSDPSQLTDPIAMYERAGDGQLSFCQLSRRLPRPLCGHGAATDHRGDPGAPAVMFLDCDAYIGGLGVRSVRSAQSDRSCRGRDDRGCRDRPTSTRGRAAG